MTGVLAARAADLSTVEEGERAAPGSLGAMDVHVWWIDLASAQARAPIAALSPDERLRAARFYAEHDRQRWMTARGALRSVLGAYVGQAPGRLSFTYGPHGKPSLAAAHDGDTLHFNLSHNDDWAILAVTRDVEIGVDLEPIRPIPEADSIVERFFAPRERAAYQAMASEDRPRAFIDWWVCKEALLKARGDGLAYPLDQIDISIEPPGIPRVMSIGGDPVETERWSLHTCGRDGFAADARHREAGPTIDVDPNLGVAP
jgi:4'-phosphopantetheinyl transferase